MTYFCFIESSLNGVPHMEPLDAENEVEAKRQAAELLKYHLRAYAAHVYVGEEKVATVTP